MFHQIFFEGGIHIVSSLFMDSGNVFHIIAALCLNVFLSYLVFGLCRANFWLSLMFLVVDCIRHCHNVLDISW